MSQRILSLHEEVEELIEAHMVDCNTLESSIEFLRVTMQSTEDMVSTSVRGGDTYRGEVGLLCIVEGIHTTRVTLFCLHFGWSAHSSW
jgi:hypothetical protein